VTDFSTLFVGLDHPAVAAEDVDVLADWYSDVLGYEKHFRNEKPVWLLRAPDGTFLEIMPKDETHRPQRTTWTPGWSHVAFRVSSLEKAMQALEQKGIRWAGDIAPAIGGGRVRNFLDPEGNLVQILER
jgi:glyoxylase I family protein